MGANLLSLLKQSSMAQQWARAACGESTPADSTAVTNVVGSKGRRNDDDDVDTSKDSRYAAVAARLDAQREAADDRVRGGMGALLIAGAEDALPVSASLADVVRKEREQAAFRLSKGRGLLSYDDGKKSEDDGQCALPVPVPLTPLTTRRCIACRSRGRSGLLASAGGPAAAANTGAAAVANGLWYKKYSVASALLPALELAMSATPAQSPSSSSSSSSSSSERIKYRLSVSNPIEQPVSLYLAVLPTKNSLDLSDAAFFSAAGEPLSMQSLPTDLLLNQASSLLLELAESSTDAIRCLLVQLSGRKAEDSDDEGTTSSDSDVDFSAVDADNAHRSPLWTAYAAVDGKSGLFSRDNTATIEIEVSRESVAEESHGSSSHFLFSRGLPRRRVTFGLVVGVPASALEARTGSSALTPAAAERRCTIVTTVHLNLPA